jgi:hypothetical protein
MPWSSAIEADSLVKQLTLLLVLLLVLVMRLCGYHLKWIPLEVRLSATIGPWSILVEVKRSISAFPVVLVTHTLCCGMPPLSAPFAQYRKTCLRWMATPTAPLTHNTLPTLLCCVILFATLQASRSLEA